MPQCRYRVIPQVLILYLADSYTSKARKYYPSLPLLKASFIFQVRSKPFKIFVGSSILSPLRWFKPTSIGIFIPKTIRKKFQTKRLKIDFQDFGSQAEGCLTRFFRLWGSVQNNAPSKCSLRYFVRIQRICKATVQVLKMVQNARQRARVMLQCFLGG